MEKNIALVGFMGAGKTVVGKNLADRLNMRFVDLDDLIEEKEGRKISQIFADSGEPYFRKVEKEITIQTAKEKGLVIACGGGVVLDKENIRALKDSGMVIYLKTIPEVILKRTKSFQHRPLLTVEDPKKKIAELLEFRSPYYNQADFTIDTSNLNVTETVGKIIEIINK